MKSAIPVSALILLSAVLCLAQTTPREDPFAGIQANLDTLLESKRQKLLAGCTRLVEPEIAGYEDAREYLDCLFGNMEDYIRDWKESSTEAASQGKGIILALLRQNSPPGSSVAERQNTMRAIVFAHKRLTAWHQRNVNLVNELFSAGLLDNADTEALLAGIENSYNNCSAVARETLEKLKQEKDLSAETVAGICGFGVDAMTKPMPGILDRIQQRMLNSLARTRRLYPSLIGRGGNNPREFAQGYDEFFGRIFDALHTNAENLWQPQEQ